jgi:hypothetical protein
LSDLLIKIFDLYIFTIQVLPMWVTHDPSQPTLTHQNNPWVDGSFTCMGMGVGQPLGTHGFTRADPYVRSYEADAMHRPSGENTTEATLSACPVIGFATTCPVPESHIRIVWCVLAVRLDVVPSEIVGKWEV